ncbi:hypothetical protein UlMin_026073 [Ulmus minor]
MRNYTLVIKINVIKSKMNDEDNMESSSPSYFFFVFVSILIFFPRRGFGCLENFTPFIFLRWILHLYLIYDLCCSISLWGWCEFCWVSVVFSLMEVSGPPDFFNHTVEEYGAIGEVDQQQQERQRHGRRRNMLPGPQQGQEKISKSDPSSSIFMEDDKGEVNVKMKKAYCPPKIAEGNSCLEFIKYLVLPWFNKFTVERSADNGGNKTLKSFEELTTDNESVELHPGDLKPSLAKALNKILENFLSIIFFYFVLTQTVLSVACSRTLEHFRTDSKAKEFLKRVKAYKVTK